MHRKNPNRKFSLRFGKEEMSTEDKRRRLRRLVPSWSFLTCLRRPLLFRFAGKEGGEKGRWVTVLCILPLNSSGPQCFGLAFHSIVTSCVSDYAPPDTGVSDLQLVAVERLPSIEGTVEIRMGVIFLRGRFYLQAPKHRLTRAHREKQLKMSCQALHNAPPNRT